MGTEVKERSIHKVDFPLTQQEWKLIVELRQYWFAEVKIEMRDGQPHRILGGIKGTML